MSARMGKKGWFVALLALASISAFAVLRWGITPAASDETPIDHAQAAPADKPVSAAMTEADVLAYLRTLPAAQRKKLLDEVTAKDAYRAAGKMPNSVKVAGTIQSKAMNEIVCLVRAESPHMPAARIRWIVKDRVKVKMGDKVLELDEEPIKQRQRAQAALIAEAQQTLQRASDQVERVQAQQHVRIQLAQADLRLAKLDLKRAGNDRKTLEAAVALAQQAIEQRQAEARVHEGQARAEQQAKKDILDKAAGHMRILEEDLTTCVLYAPRNGQVVHASRLEANSQVNEGQKILWVCDLDDVKMSARSAEKKEPGLGLVRPGQSAYIRINLSRFRGEVGVVRRDKGFIFLDVEFLKDKKSGDNSPLFLPDTAATAVIVIDEKAAGCLIPSSAVLGPAAERFCFVLQGAEVHERPVRTGLIDELQERVEVHDGLKEGELILADAHPALTRLIEVLKDRR